MRVVKPKAVQGASVTPIHKNLSFGQFLRMLRKGKLWSQRDLAKAVNVKPPYISEIENDVKVPSDELCIRMANALEVPPSELLQRSKRQSSADLITLLEDTREYSKQYDEEINEFLDAYKSLDAQGRECVKALVRQMASYISGKKKI